MISSLLEKYEVKYVFIPLSIYLVKSVIINLKIMELSDLFMILYL